ncbi:MAG: L-histidine N(alpha)-methyltransferase [Bryobacteraceae bacterium]|jgi:L-histidine N-alpha-methyltransferase
MSASAKSELSHFAVDVAEGLSCGEQKRIAPKYFYDDLGTVLFQAITLLPEYGLTRADENLLRLHAKEIISATGPLSTIAELGSGTGRKTRHILAAASHNQPHVLYIPIDVSRRALAACERELSDLSEVQPLCSDWIAGLQQIAQSRSGNEPLLLLFLGSSIGNLERDGILDFLQSLRSNLRPGDFFLLGADLVKNIDTMTTAYDDPTGVTAAFNLNVLARINRELDADFDLRSFAHEVRWNSDEQRIEMHLLSGRNQVVSVGVLDATFKFRAGETICTEYSHKFTLSELRTYARLSGFRPIETWVDSAWPFAEVLWQIG